MSTIVSKSLLERLSTFLIPTNILLTIFGITSNIANIVTFSKIFPKDTMTISLTALAVSDLLYCSFNLFYYAIRSLSTLNGIHVLFRVDLESLILIGFLWQKPLFHKISSVITAFVSSERCLCVQRPFLVKRLFTKKRCIAVVVLIYLSMTAIFMPVYVSGHLAWASYPNSSQRLLVAHFSPQRDAAEAVVLIGGAPSVVVVTQTIILISAIFMSLTLRRHQQFRRSMHSFSLSTVKDENQLSSSSNNHSNESNSQGKIYYSTNSKHVRPTDASLSTQQTTSKEDRLIQTVLTLAVMHIVLNTPLLIFYMAYQFVPGYHTFGKYNNIFVLTQDMINVLQTINGVFNIFVYLTLNTKYRTLFIETFLPHKCLN